ncbi:sporulation protein YunB [Bacillus lacus]|uniref:Sporulation protein YunB n=1 Tax=Metabacillus lacus TaxID=1983721 RepID=A0A7X2J2C9_9BACI|nr:sporulation protein YunB [Metabacillus lacus]MRX74066.1 sporulation protein YunB [Metabacillus lacus]
MLKRKRFLYRGARPRRKPLSGKQVFVLSFFLFLLLNLMSLMIVDRAIKPILMSMSRTEIKEITTDIISQTIRNSVSNVDLDDIIVIRENEENSARTYSFNQSAYNRIVADVSDEISEKLGEKTNQLDKDMKTSVTYKIPLGSILGSSVLSSYGPKIPVETYLVSDVSPEIKTRLTSSGINNTFLELYIHLKVNIEVVIPALKDQQTIDTNIKLGDLFIPGDVPQYYGGGKGDGGMPIIIENSKSD